MAINRREANLKKLKDADAIQDKTQIAIRRIQRQAVEAEQLGTHALEEMRRQGTQMDDIDAELVVIDTKLETTKALQNKYDTWAGNWSGRKKRQALERAAEEIQERHAESYTRVKEVFQHETYRTFKRKWKSAGLVLCTNPTVDCSDLFDPEAVLRAERSRWIIDFSLAGIDAEGWTYAYDFATLNRTGAGDPAPKWNSYVRRRKWIHTDFVSRLDGDAMTRVVARNLERKTKAASENKAALLADSTLPSVLLPTGYRPRGGSSGADQQALDEDSAAGLARLREKDAEIDAGIDAISRTIDNLTSIGSAMKDEMAVQSQKLGRIEDGTQRNLEKEAVVNARQRSFVRHA